MTYSLKKNIYGDITILKTTIDGRFKTQEELSNFYNREEIANIKEIEYKGLKLVKRTDEKNQLDIYNGDKKLCGYGQVSSKDMTILELFLSQYGAIENLVNNTI